MGKGLKVVGLQRSGTNYLTELLRINFKELVYTQPLKPFFKHCMSYETSVRLANRVIHKFPVPTQTDCEIIIIKKTKQHWLASMNRNPMDIFQKRPHLSKALLGDFYDTYSKSWVGFYTVNYEDLLRDLQKELLKIQNRFNLNPKQKPFLNISKVPHNKLFTETDKKRYL